MRVWINGRCHAAPASRSIQGFNIPNRVVLSDSVKVGDKFQIAIFAINGPISVAPQALIEFYK
jgi:hypothetical protein